jgi:hypothetical protein
LLAFFSFSLSSFQCLFDNAGLFCWLQKELHYQVNDSTTSKEPVDGQSSSSRKLCEFIREPNRPIEIRARACAIRGANQSALEKTCKKKKERLSCEPPLRRII